jgi:hypothetical protein
MCCATPNSRATAGDDYSLSCKQAWLENRLERIHERDLWGCEVKIKRSFELMLGLSPTMAVMSTNARFGEGMMLQVYSNERLIDKIEALLLSPRAQ